MKVFELFEADLKRLQSNAQQFPNFKPTSSGSGLGDIRGSVKDWMDALGATPQDIEKAVMLVKNSSLFRNEFPKAGLMYDARPLGEKNGTLAFKVKREYDNGYKTGKGGYLVYANGQIRSLSSSDYTSPLKAPKPRLKAGNPSKSIEMTMLAAMEELLNKWKKSYTNPKK